MTAKIEIVPASELTAKNLTAKYYVNLPQWGWDWALDEHVHGPFKTREAALKDAKRCGATHVTLGHIVYPKEKDCFYCSVDTVLSDANEVAQCSALNDDDRTFFKIKREDKAEAQKRLGQFMARWARKWVVPTKKIFRVVEEVRVE